MIRAAGFILALALLPGQARPPAPSRFAKVSEHCYYLAPGDGGANSSAIVTDDGIVLVDPPRPEAAPGVLEALRRLTAKPVRWVAITRPRPEQLAGAAYFQERNASLLVERAGDRVGPAKGTAASDKPAWRLVFTRQLHLFPGGVEVRVLGVEPKAHSDADLVVVLPAERVVVAGDLFVPGSFPEIDAAAGGSALGWLDAARQVIDAVPLLRSAIPPPRPGAGQASKAGAGKAADDRPLEETVAVIPGRGPAANLADLKELHATAQRLRGEIARGIASGRSRDALLGALAVAPYRDYKGLEAFAGRLFDEIARK